MLSLRFVHSTDIRPPKDLRAGPRQPSFSGSSGGWPSRPDPARSRSDVLVDPGRSCFLTCLPVNERSCARLSRSSGTSSRPRSAEPWRRFVPGGTQAGTRSSCYESASCPMPCAQQVHGVDERANELPDHPRPEVLRRHLPTVRTNGRTNWFDEQSSRGTSSGWSAEWASSERSHHQAGPTTPRPSVRPWCGQAPGDAALETAGGARNSGAARAAA